MGMAYNDFTLEDIKKKFQLLIRENINLFSQVESVEVSDTLQTVLQEYVPLALAINTEKSRSEMMIAPILIEFRRMVKHHVSLFSGLEFNVDTQQGLNMAWSPRAIFGNFYDGKVEKYTSIWRNTISTILARFWASCRAW
jgi:hypothetical protein